MSGDGQSSGKGEPKDSQQANNESGRKEQTPDGPQQDPGQPQGQDKEPGMSGQPDSNKNGPPESSQTGGPSEDAVGAPLMAVNGKDQWGNLPVHLRDLFRAEGGTDLPPRYRDWIDSYYRRLNERDSD
ncbi:MAG TPA: hypothetical protein QF446_05295 [Planctomycetota bacterium]|jgi:hypothetical protein|nr:hypothetical protein [Planctomycetaceae bacterium]HJM56722.1 hypothetical protein [Planctomycetota bacterium]